MSYKNYLNEIMNENKSEWAYGKDEHGDYREIPNDAGGTCREYIHVSKGNIRNN